MLSCRFFLVSDTPPPPPPPPPPPTPHVFSPPSRRVFTLNCFLRVCEFNIVFLPSSVVLLFSLYFPPFFFPPLGTSRQTSDLAPNVAPERHKTLTQPQIFQPKITRHMPPFLWLCRPTNPLPARPPNLHRQAVLNSYPLCFYSGLFTQQWPPARGISNNCPPSPAFLAGILD